MDTKRFAEHFRCDALRLALLLGGEDSTYSDGIGNAFDFPLAPKQREMLDDDIRFIRVEGEEYYEIGYVTDSTPLPKDTKYRNKSFHRVIVGREIRRARIAAGMPLSELAEKTNLREHSLMRIEEGRWDIDLSLLGVILDVLDKKINFV